jgi:1,4-alpha-glucan branching enzyme
MESAAEGLAAVRRSLVSFDEKVLARYWDEQAAVRQAFRGLLGLFESPSADVVFTLSDVQAETVTLAGEFNGWSRSGTPLARGDDGTWRVTVALKPGRYLYKYLLDGEHWENDPRAETVPNPYGSLDSVVIVKPS